MSSRQEEKERRRQERLAAEREAAERQSRRRRIGLAAGGLLLVAAAIVVVLVLTGGGGEGKKKPDTAAKMLDARVQASARAAGCSAQTFPTFGRNHVEGRVKYATNPPTSGDHDASPASDGIYDAGGTPPAEKLVHALEHGRVLFQYKPGTSKSVVTQLQTLITGPGPNGRAPGYNQLLFQNATQMRYQVAATAWTRLLSCPKFQGAPTMAALRTFRDAYVDKAPEFVPVPE